MLEKFFIFLVTIFGCGLLINGSELPSGVKPCSKSLSSTDLNQCLKDGITKMLPIIKESHTQFNLPQIEPYNLGRNRFNYNQGAVQARLNTNNTLAYGMLNAKIKDVRSKLTDKKVQLAIDAYFPKIRVEADYKGQAKFNRENYKSEGRVNITLNGAACTFKVQGMIENINGEDYLVIKSIKLSNANVKDLKLDATGLLEDSEVNKVVLEFINQNWRTFYKDVAPQIYAVLEPVYLEIANSVCKTVPFDKLMPNE